MKIIEQTVESVTKAHIAYANNLKSRWSYGQCRDQFPTRDSLLAYLDSDLKNKIELVHQAERERELAKLAEKERLEQEALELERNVKKIKSDWYIQYPQMKCALKQFQVSATEELWNKMFVEDLSAALLLSGVGTGKTFDVGYLILKAFLEGRYNNCIAPYPFLVVTKATVVEQFKRVLQFQFGLDVVNKVMVTNYDALRSSFGEQFLDCKTVVRQGEPEVVFEWHSFIHPQLVVWDECHSLKNKGSQQSKIAQALCQKDNVKQIFMSATPFTRLTDMLCFVSAMKLTPSKANELLRGY